MPPVPPDTEFQLLGSTIRAARVARGLTQQQLAKLADVSRAQLALLEKGGNISVRFLRQVCRPLELTTISVASDLHLQLSSSPEAVSNVGELLRTMDLLAAVVEHLRELALESVLPHSERRALTDAPAIREFVLRHSGDEEGLARLGEALAKLAHDRPVNSTPSVPKAARPDRRIKRRAR